MINLDTTGTYKLWEILKNVEYYDFDEDTKDFASWLKGQIEASDEITILDSRELPF